VLAVVGDAREYARLRVAGQSAGAGYSPIRATDSPRNIGHNPDAENYNTAGGDMNAVVKRVAGLPQGILLVACTWLAVMASAALIGPILPRMSQYFAALPDVATKIDNVAGMPPLLVAIFAAPMGWLADRVGARRVLLMCTAVYGALGAAPAFLDNLDTIVYTRALVGIAEAGIMTCAYMMIAAYFNGAARERWFALTTGTAPLMALVSILLGGSLGDQDWHKVFLVYGFGLLLFLGTLTLLWEVDQTGGQSGSLRSADLSGFKWGRLAAICIISLFAMSAFLITVIQTGFLMTERGIDSPAVIGRWQSLASLANPVGALCFGLLKWRYPRKLVIALLLMAVGFSCISQVSGWQAVIWGGAIANLGCGMMLPTLVSWGLQDLPLKVRGVASGVLMAANFLGQFFSPHLVTYLKGATGSLDHAVFAFAIGCVIVAIVSVPFVRLMER
jgi:MFS family permease